MGVGSGRKRLNILGAYSPDDHDYVDLRLTKENITGEQFVALLERWLAKHPDTEKFLLYLDNAQDDSKQVVKEWLARHRQFRLVFLPAYSPNLNLIERLWKFLRKEALNRWHKTFEEMQGAVADVLDHLGALPHGVGQPDEREVSHPQGRGSVPQLGRLRRGLSLTTGSGITLPVEHGSGMARSTPRDRSRYTRVERVIRHAH